MKIHLFKQKERLLLFFLYCILFFLFVSCLNGSEKHLPDNKLLNMEIFKNPGKGHYPETWFHFIGGNIILRLPFMQKQMVG